MPFSEIHESLSLEDMKYSKVSVQFLDSDDVIRGGTEGGGIVMLPGTPEQMDLHWRGENGWQVAIRVFQKAGW